MIIYYFIRFNMTRQFPILIFIATAICAGCQNQRPVTTEKEITQPVPDSLKLKTQLGTAGQTFTKDSVLLSFTVINETDTIQRFCKWETPFEPKLGKYFDVQDEQGGQAQFTGAMARRVMPPPAESYIEVPPRDSVRTVFNLAKKYVLHTGPYTVKYTGGGVSGLKAANDIQLTIKAQ